MINLELRQGIYITEMVTRG